MHELYAYRIGVKEEVDETAFNRSSPLQITHLEAGAAGTYFHVFTDQSGLIGLLRHLHRQGFILLYVQRADAPKFESQTRSTT